MVYGLCLKGSAHVLLLHVSWAFNTTFEIKWSNIITRMEWVMYSLWIVWLWLHTNEISHFSYFLSNFSNCYCFRPALVVFDDIMIVASVWIRNMSHHNFFIIIFFGHTCKWYFVFCSAKDNFMQWTFESFVTNCAVNVYRVIFVITHSTQHDEYATDDEREWMIRSNERKRDAESNKKRAHTKS